MEDFFLWGLEINDTLTQELVSKISVIAAGVGIICFICNLAYNYLSHGASQLLTPNEDKFPDLQEIARCIALLFCLSLYSPIAKTVVGTLEVINEATSMTSDRSLEFAEYVSKASSEQGEMLTEYQKTALEEGVAAKDENSEAMSKELDNMSQDNRIEETEAGISQITEYLNPANWASASIHAIVALLAGIIQVVILGIAVVSLKVLVILGPLVFAFSILPVFQRQLANWFGTVCSLGIVFTVINILNQIMWYSLKGIFTSGSDMVDAATKQIQYLGLDIAIIGAYCSCFWLASKIVGHNDAGRIISKTVSVVTSAAALMMLGGAAGAKAANSIRAAASTGKSMIDEQ